MASKDETPFEHPLRSRNDVPRSDVRRATAPLAEALDAMLAAHAPGAGDGGADNAGVDGPARQRVMEELARCAGGHLGVTDIAVGDVLLRFTTAAEADAAAISASINHTGLSGKAAWFKGTGGDDTTWVVLVIPSR